MYDDLDAPSSGFQPPSPVEGEGIEQESCEFLTCVAPPSRGEGFGPMSCEIPTCVAPPVEGEGNNIPRPCVGEGARRAGEGSKQNLRKWIKNERKKLDIEKISNILSDKLKELDEYKNAKNIMLYYPLNYEINLLKIMDDKTKQFYLPRIEKNNLLCCPFSNTDKLCISSFKTKEPMTNPIDKNKIDLIIIPALAVDKNNYRLGYGGGFYDRFLSDINTYKVVCIPKEFVLETIFPEQHDIQIDKIICE